MALLAAIAVAFAWTIFRINADASLRGTLTAAKARLLAVENGVVQGWAKTYMAKPWTPHDIAEVWSSTLADVHDETKRLYQVIPVTASPLAALSTATEIGEHFISPSTVGSAGTAVWQIGRLNDAIQQQSLFNAMHAPARYRALELGRGRTIDAIARSAAEINTHVHEMLGDAATNWYAELRDGVAHDLWKIERNERFCTRVVCLRPWLVVGDLSAVSVVVGAALVAFLT